MTANTISELCEAHVGKVSDKWSRYIHVYDVLFEGIRENVKSLLEVGVQNGGSLEIWAKYFHRPINIVGCDVNERCGDFIFEDSRIDVSWLVILIRSYRELPLKGARDFMMWLLMMDLIVRVM